MNGARKHLLLFFWLMTLPVMVFADPELTVTQQQQRFHLSLKTYVDLPIDDLWHKLTNYSQLKQYHPAIVESEALTESSEKTLVKTRLQDCLLWFCKDFDRVQSIQQPKPYTLVSYTIPEQSDFSYGRQRWQLIPKGSGSMLYMELEVEPKEKLLPWIGPAIVKYKMKSATEIFLERLRLP